MVSPATASADTLLVYEVLPQWFQDGDAANGYPFLSWLEGICQQLQAIDDLVRDDAEGNPGWSIILDVNRAPTEWLPWLAQWVGVRFTSAQLQSDAAMRAAIKTPSGFARGTPAAIIAAGNLWLNSGYSCSLSERTTDAYHYTVNVPSAGLTGGTFGDLATQYASFAAVQAAFPTFGDITAQTDAIEAALKAANPAGLVQSVAYV